MAFRVLRWMRKLSIVRVVIFTVAVLGGVRVRVWGRHLVCQFGRHLAARIMWQGCPANRQPESLPHIAVMIEAEPVLDAAIRSRQQPEHHCDRRSDAEGKMDFWLPGNHTLSSLFVFRRQARVANAATRRLRRQLSVTVFPCRELGRCPTWSHSRRPSRHRKPRRYA